jgi:hypothetical protein
VPDLTVSLLVKFDTRRVKKLYQFMNKGMFTMRLNEGSELFGREDDVIVQAEEVEPII